MIPEPVSCLMITRPGRLDLVRESMACFAYQTHGSRELVIVHDGGPGFHAELAALTGEWPATDIRVCTEAAGHTLGWLRNRSLELARHDLVCQWDDDDLYHPQRLEMQYRQMHEQGADFCFLTDQLHLFVAKGFLFWDDWSVETWPGNLIQGTLLGRKALLSRYPDQARGEDTEVTLRIVRDGHRIATLPGMGWLYIYRYTGDNAWEFEHHAAISRWKRRGEKRLLEQADTLNRELRRYQLADRSLVMPHENGRLVLDID